MEKGILYLVATPIGNLKDITLRALKVLREVDVILAEDTRNTVKLLNHYAIKKPLKSYHKFNEKETAGKIVEELLMGKKMALVSDAGTPAISDPGEELVKAAILQDIRVVPIPGASAFTEALIASGLSASLFTFVGFLPTKGKERKELLEYTKTLRGTVIFYEAPHRVGKTLKELAEVMGDRQAVIGRELTKKFEEFLRGTLLELAERLQEREIKGEFVLLVEGISKEEEKRNKEEKADYPDSVEEHIRLYLTEGFSKKEAVKKVAEERDLKKKEVYSIAIRMEGNEKEV